MTHTYRNRQRITFKNKEEYFAEAEDVFKYIGRSFGMVLGCSRTRISSQQSPEEIYDNKLYERQLCWERYGRDGYVKFTNYRQKKFTKKCIRARRSLMEKKLVRDPEAWEDGIDGLDEKAVKGIMRYIYGEDIP